MKTIHTEEFKASLREEIALAIEVCNRDYPDWSPSEKNNFVLGWLKGEAGFKDVGLQDRGANLLLGESDEQH